MYSHFPPLPVAEDFPGFQKVIQYIPIDRFPSNPDDKPVLLPVPHENSRMENH